VELFQATLDPKRVEIDPKATIRRPSGARTRVRLADVLIKRRDPFTRH